MKDEQEKLADIKVLEYLKEKLVSAGIALSFVGSRFPVFWVFSPDSILKRRPSNRFDICGSS
jgi:hypothetical protein